MKKDVSQRGVESEFDTFMDELYDPLVRYSREHLEKAHYIMSAPDLRIGVDALGVMYSQKEAGFSHKAEKILQEHGNSMSQEAILLASTLVWIGRYGHDKNPHTDFIQIGPKSVIAYQDRVLKGLTVTFKSNELGSKNSIDQLRTDEKNRSVSAFIPETMSTERYPIWRLKAGTLDLKANQDEGSIFNLELLAGNTDPVSGTEFTLNVTPNSGRSPSVISAVWSDTVEMHHSDDRKLRLLEAKNIRSTSGNSLIDVRRVRGSTTYDYSMKRARNPWTSVGISEHASEGLIQGRDVIGANLQTEKGERLELVSVRTDDYAANRAPGTFIEIDEYTIGFDKKGKHSNGKKETKRMKLPQVRFHITFPPEHGKDGLARFKDNLDSLFEPITTLLEESAATESKKSK